MKIELYLTQQELNSILDDLNQIIELEVAEKLIKDIYICGDGRVKRHSYSYIGGYIRENNELDLLFANLDSLIERLAENEPQLANVVFKLKDHISIELTREFEKEDMKSELRELKELRDDIQRLTSANTQNIEEIQNIQSNITKEIVAISAVLITIVTFILGNIGAIQFINEHTVALQNSNTTLFEFLIQVNLAIISGVSSLMLIIGAFVHKKSEGNFFFSSKCLVSLIILIVSIGGLFFLVKA